MPTGNPKSTAAEKLLFSPGDTVFIEQPDAPDGYIAVKYYGYAGICPKSGRPLHKVKHNRSGQIVTVSQDQFRAY